MVHEGAPVVLPGVVDDLVSPHFERVRGVGGVVVVVGPGPGVPPVMAVGDFRPGWAKEAVSCPVTVIFVPSLEGFVLSPLAARHWVVSCT